MVAGVVTLSAVFWLALRAPAGRSRPDGSSYFAVSAMVLISQAALFVVLSFNSSEDVTDPVLVLVWCAGICIAAAIWMVRGDDDGGGGGGWDDKQPEPVQPGGLNIPWETFDQQRREWDFQPSHK